MAEESRSRLGRGLAALIGEAAVEETSAAGRGQRRVALDLLRPNPRNPRRHFGEGYLDELAASIAQKGVLQPLLVRGIKGAEGYEIIAGERRWRAAQRAKQHDVPVIVLEVNDREAMEIAIIENIQRADLNPIEEATGYEQLRAQFNYKPEDLARAVGKSRSHVVNMMRLLKLPERVREHLTSGKLSAGHARALLAFPDPEAVAERVLHDGLTVREVEALAQERAAAAEGRQPERRPRIDRDADTVALENALREATGLDVRINHRDEAGEIRIRYRTLEQLDDVARRLRA